jgi:heptosyltransferase-2
VSEGARLVVRAPNWLGDMVMSLPALGAVRRHFSTASLAVAAPAGLAAFYKAVPGVDQIVPLPAARGWGGLAAHVAATRAGRFDTAILLTNSFSTAWAAWRAGVPQRWGYRRDMRGLLLTRAVSRRAGATSASRHQADYYRRLVEALGMPSEPGFPALVVPDTWRARSDALLVNAGLDPSRPIVGYAPGAAYGGAKRWPPARVAAVIARMLQETGASCVLVGAAGDRATGHAVESAMGDLARDAHRAGRFANAIGRTDLPALIGLVAKCRAFLSNDSGAMHVAAALGVHVAAVFGPTDERATSPLGPHTALTAQVFCRPCHLRECPIDHRCMLRIDTDHVFTILRQQLDRPPGAA